MKFQFFFLENKCEYFLIRNMITLTNGKEIMSTADTNQNFICSLCLEAHANQKKKIIDR